MPRAAAKPPRREKEMTRQEAAAMMAKNMVEGAKLAVELAKEKKLQARIKG